MKHILDLWIDSILFENEMKNQWNIICKKMIWVNFKRFSWDEPILPSVLRTYDMAILCRRKYGK